MARYEQAPLEPPQRHRLVRPGPKAALESATDRRVQCLDGAYRPEVSRVEVLHD
jgi:hypothetical protein